MKEATRIQIENMKKTTVGIEIEMNNITREKAARTAAELFGTGRYADTAAQNGYCSWSAWDAEGREWKFQRDVSIAGPDSQKCELVSPIMHYDQDIELLQELIRALRRAGAKSSADRGCGVHVHLGSDGHTPQTIRNLVNLMAAHEDSLSKAIRIDRWRQERYCGTVDPRFLERLNKQKPKTMEALERCWYNGTPDHSHYSRTRYRMCNLHSLFTRWHTIEFRCFQYDGEGDGRKGGLHAGQTRAFILLALALNELAKEVRYASPKKGQRDNEAYSFRCFMLRLGMIGPEFKTARDYYMRNFEGSSAWRNGRPA